MGAHHIAGFSLIKFTSSLMLVAMLALGMAPVYYQFMNNYRATNFTNTLVHSLQVARSKAVHRAAAVSVCASDNGRTCTDTPWSDGYIVFSDDAAPGVRDVEDRVLLVMAAHHSQVNVTLTGGHYVRFLPNGGLLARAPAEEGKNRYASAASTNWFARLSPVSSAVASDDVNETDTMTSGETASGAVKTGAFTVCVGPSGRAININALGRISTSRIPCE
jgi:type IV fimbrial biogenesis protein FimT